MSVSQSCWNRFVSFEPCRIGLNRSSQKYYQVPYRANQDKTSALPGRVAALNLGHLDLPVSGCCGCWEGERQRCRVSALVPHVNINYTEKKVNYIGKKKWCWLSLPTQKKVKIVELIKCHQMSPVEPTGSKFAKLGPCRRNEIEGYGFESGCMLMAFLISPFRSSKSYSKCNLHDFF